MIGLGGLGTIMVGLAPENTISSVHILGAALPFIFTNIALIILGFSLPISRTLRIYSVISGTAAIIALVLFINKIYLGLGIGGMERIVSYPQTIWLVVLGFYLLSKPKLLIDEHRKLSV